MYIFFFIFLIIYFNFIFRFSQSFIDIREKERKRGIRGLVSVPQNSKIDEKLLESINDTNSGSDGSGGGSTSENSNKFKPEDLIELQEKITKEILSTKLQEKEMHELQVSYCKSKLVYMCLQ